MVQILRRREREEEEQARNTQRRARSRHGQTAEEQREREQNKNTQRAAHEEISTICLSQNIINRNENHFVHTCRHYKRSCDALIFCHKIAHSFHDQRRQASTHGRQLEAQSYEGRKGNNARYGGNMLYSVSFCKTLILIFHRLFI